jgi:hypothetical protein
VGKSGGNSPVKKKYKEIVRTGGWVLTIANEAETNSSTCLPKTEELEIINFDHPSHD